MKTELRIPHLTVAVESRLAALAKDRVAERLVAKDATLWTDDLAHHEVAARRLGWLDVATSMRAQVDDVQALAGELVEDGVRDVLLLGMGGSSLCAELYADAFGSADGRPRLRVVDTTDPDVVRDVNARLDPERTAVIVSSKSGTTIETISLYEHLAERIADRRRFIAITDPGTPLAELASAQGFRRTFENPADVGGRYSALSLVGLVPAAIIGVPVERLLSSAEAMAEACRRTELSENPGVLLGAVLAEAASAGRDKLTLVPSPRLSSLGAWVEQLVAESSGKSGVGIVPIDDEELAHHHGYGDDRLFARIRLGDAREPELDDGLDALAHAERPVVTLEVPQVEDLGGELYRWMFATAVACSVLGVNAFDEPNVSEAKKATLERLECVREGEPLPERESVAIDGDLEAHVRVRPPDKLDVTDVLRSHLARKRDGDYIGLLAFLPPTDAVRERLGAIRRRVREATKLAVTVGFGPRYLHSTGQLHVGGPPTGLFIMITRAPDDTDAEIPGDSRGFGTLQWAQALGSFQVLGAHARRVVRCHVSGDLDEGLAALEHVIENALG